MTYGATEDIAVRYVLDLIDKGSAQLLEKDRAIRKSTGETANVMRRQAEQASRDSHLVTSAADRSARAYMRTGSSSLNAAREIREASTIGVSAYERTSRAAQDMERRTERSMTQTRQHLRQTHGALRDFARAGIALGGTYLGFEKAKGAVESTLQLAKETNRLHKATGLTVQQSSALVSVTRARGLETTKLEGALTRLGRATDAVNQSTGKQHASLAKLDSVAHTFTGRQHHLAEVALTATAGSNRQVTALGRLKQALADDATAATIAAAGHGKTTEAQARQTAITKAQATEQKNAVTQALQAADASGKQAEALQRLGLSQDDIKRGAHDMDFLLKRVADGLSNLKGGAERLNVTQQIFGRGSGRLMGILGDYEEQIKLAKQYGATLDGHTIKSLDQLEEAQRKVKLSNTALKISFTQAVQPALGSLANAASDVSRAWSDPKLNFDQRLKKTTEGLDKLHIGEHLGKAIELGLPLVAKSAAKAAPVILGAIAKGFAHAGLVGDAVILAWATKKLGLWGMVGKAAGKAFFAKFAETSIGANFLERFLPSKAKGGGIVGKAEGLVGATPATAMWVRVAGGSIPGAPGGHEPIPTRKPGAIARTLETAGKVTVIGGLAAAGGEVFTAAQRSIGISTNGNNTSRGAAFVTREADTATTDVRQLRDRGMILSNINSITRELAKSTRGLRDAEAAGEDPSQLKAYRTHIAKLKGDLDDLQAKVAPAFEPVSKASVEAAQRVVLLRDRLSHLQKGTDAYKQTANNLRGAQRQLNSTLGNTQDAGARGAKGLRTLGDGAFSASGSVASAASSIASNVNQLATKLGGQGVSFHPVTAARGGGGGFGNTLAGGGWVGFRGERGHDTVPAMLGRGEAVLNRHQQAAIEGLLGHGFLDRLFASEQRPHYLASGGRPNLVPNVTIEGPAGGYQRDAQSAANQMDRAAERYAYKLWNGPVNKMVRFGRQEVAKHYPYVYGGGHGGFHGPYDCSGFVSAILHAGGFLGSPITTDGLKGWGLAGDGSRVTVGVRGTTGRSAHTMIKVGDTYFESGGSGGGAHEMGSWDGNFPIHRHPAHLARGGMVDSTNLAGIPAFLRDRLRKHPELLDPHHPAWVGYGLAAGGRVQRMAWGGAQAAGGDYTVNRPTLFVAGEKGPEHASFRPLAKGGRITAEDLIDKLAASGITPQSRHASTHRLSQLPDVLERVSWGPLGDLISKVLRREIGLRSTDRTQGHDITVSEAKIKGLGDDLDKARKAHNKTRVAALSKELETEKARLTNLKHDEQRTGTRLANLEKARLDVRKTQQTRIDRGAARATNLAAQAERIETLTDRRFRRLGIDASSVDGLQTLINDSGKEEGTLKRSRAAIQAQIKRAQKIGDRGRVAQLKQQLGEVNDNLGETRTVEAERRRDLARRQQQDKVDLVDFDATRADTGLSRLQISQQLLGTAGTKSGQQEIADYINNKIIPIDQQRVDALQAKLKELQGETTPDAELIRETLLEIDSAQAKRDQDSLDATNAVKESVDENFKEFGGSAAFSYRGQDELDAGVGL